VSSSLGSFSAGGCNSGAFDSGIPGVFAVWGLLLNQCLAICSDRTAKYCFGVEGLEPSPNLLGNSSSRAVKSVPTGDAVCSEMTVESVVLWDNWWPR